MRTITTFRHPASTPTWLLWGYLLLITLAEIVTAVIQPQAGLVIHALLLVGLTLYGAAGQLNQSRKLALALTLAPLIRLLSLSLPLIRFPQVAWYPIVAVPLLVATWIVVRILGIRPQQIGLRLGNLPLQLLICGCGLGIGVVEYSILQPKPLLEAYSWGAIILPVLSLVIFTGFTEEVIFRGLLQTVATPALGRWALTYVSLLFAALHIGYLSVADIVLVFVVGMLFGQIVRWGGSILGVTLAHGLTNITLFLIMPYLTQHASGLTLESAPWVIWGGTAIGIVAIDLLMLRATVHVAAVQLSEPNVPTAAQLRGIRIDCGMTYSDLGQRTGLPARQLAEIEHGLRLAQPEQIQRIAQALGVDLQRMAGGVGA